MNFSSNEKYATTVNIFSKKKFRNNINITPTSAQIKKCSKKKEIGAKLKKELTKGKSLHKSKKLGSKIKTAYW